MNFEIGEGSAGQSSSGKRRGIQTIVVDRLPDAYAVSVGTRKCVCVKFSDERETAKERLIEAHALFFGEAYDFDGEG